jgi:ribonuclease HIII
VLFDNNKSILFRIADDAAAKGVLLDFDLYKAVSSNPGKFQEQEKGFSDMALLVGIDEAGFGPILGPLVVSAVQFTIPDKLLKSDMWQLLSDSVSDSKKHLSGRLLIADSKKAYSRSAGIRHLQRTVLASLACLGEKPQTFDELLTLLCPECKNRLADYPWYQGQLNHSFNANKDDIAIAAKTLERDLNANRIKLLNINSFCFDVGYYNEIVGRVKNKSTMLFTAVCGLIQKAINNSNGRNLQIIIDRQGGRTHYTQPLRRMFSGLDLKVLKENDKLSSYELAGASKTIRLHFVVKADDNHLPAALASMTSKFLRELLIQRINTYFASHCAELKPTAGYWKDGSRFIEDLKKFVPHIEYNRKQLIRCR